MPRWKPLTGRTYWLFFLLIVLGISISFIFIIRSCERLNAYRAQWGPPVGWQPVGETITEPVKVAVPKIGYTVSPAAVPIKTEEDKKRSIFYAPPSTLAEGGDVRDLIPEVEIFGPMPGSAAAEKCEESSSD